jgi:archaellum biogenesis protein FlaJ (TadC family)
MYTTGKSLGERLGKPFKIYMYNRSVLGMSVTDALRRTADRCPYRELRDTFIGMADAIETTGDPSNVLTHIFDKGIIKKRGELEKKIRNSMLIGEFYISLIILFPMILIVMMVIFNMIGGGIFGFDPASLIALVTYLTLPLSLMIYLMVGD